MILHCSLRTGHLGIDWKLLCGQNLCTWPSLLGPAVSLGTPAVAILKCICLGMVVCCCVHSWPNGVLGQLPLRCVIILSPVVCLVYPLWRRNLQSSALE